MRNDWTAVRLLYVVGLYMEERHSDAGGGGVLSGTIDRCSSKIE
jgi:hypothetical protein